MAMVQVKEIYKPLLAKIEDVITETSNIKTFVISPEEKLAFKTGQFVELTVPGFGEAPFTPSSDPNIKERLEITIMKAGQVTGVLHNLRPQDSIGIRGPYGKGYDLDKFKNKEVLIVGGGVGLAPLRSLVFSLLNEISLYKKVILCYGARTPEDIVYKSLLKAWGSSIEVHTTVDKATNGWKGNVGVVTKLLDNLKLDLKNTVAVVCGPPIMMKFSTFKLLEMEIDPGNISLSMEKNMSCGLGKCGHCRMGKFYVCKDGPVFAYSDIKQLPDLWE